MKRIIALIFGFVVSFMLYSQNYYPLVEDGKTWNVLNVFPTGGWPPFDTAYNTESFNLSGDSIIGNIEYKKLYSSSEEIPVNWSLWGFMREDDNKRVWFREDAQENEFLMYDFSVESGDSVLVENGDPVYLYVDSITEIVINEMPRQKYWMSCKMMPEYRETWIEGIGSNKGICWSGSAFIVGGWSWLLCMSMDNELIYKNPNYNTCYYLIDDVLENEHLNISLFPNPANGFITIESGANDEIESIALVSLSGELIRQFTPETTQLNIKGLFPGVYILKISCNNEILVKKIIITN